MINQCRCLQDPCACECHSCGYPTKALNAYRRSGIIEAIDATEKKLLCFLCAGTITGRALDYPEQYSERRILQTICFAANTILDRLGALEAKP